MEVILLEKVQGLGSIGDIVKIKDGFGRNFLIPRKKAIRATEAAKSMFEQKRAEIEKQNSALKNQAETVDSQINGKYFTVIRQAGEDGKLFGSVTAKDIATAINSNSIDKTNVYLTGAVKFIGIYPIKVILHSDIETTILLNVARSDSEADEAIVVHKRSSSSKEESETSEESKE